MIYRPRHTCPLESCSEFYRSQTMTRLPVPSSSDGKHDTLRELNLHLDLHRLDTKGKVLVNIVGARIQSIPSTREMHRHQKLIEHIMTSSKIYSLCGNISTTIDSESRATPVSTSR